MVRRELVGQRGLAGLSGPEDGRDRKGRHKRGDRGFVARSVNQEGKVTNFD
jgi:hypothetical protein